MSKSHPRWRLAKKILTWLFFIAVIVLLVALVAVIQLGGDRLARGLNKR